MKMNQKHRRSPSRRGSTILELAILLPLLLTIALLCVDFGRFAHTYIAVNNAARAGAAYACMHPFTPVSQATWEANTRQAVVDEMDASGWFDSNKLQIPAPQSFNEGSGRWRVRVEVCYAFETLINWPFLPGYNDPIQLTKVVVMRTIR
jgi:Flp pilus assembly protein TadG